MEIPTVSTIATKPRGEALRAALHARCFACAPDREEGLGLVFHTDGDAVVRATWQPSGRFQSYDGRVHGGILATLIDASMVHALFARGVAGVTAEMTVRYHCPVLLDASVEVVAWVESRKLGLHRLRAEIRQTGRIAAEARAKFMALREPVS